jgi:hypothetical protein
MQRGTELRRIRRRAVQNRLAEDRRWLIPVAGDVVDDPVRAGIGDAITRYEEVVVADELINRPSSLPGVQSRNSRSLVSPMYSELSAHRKM